MDWIYIYIGNHLVCITFLSFSQFSDVSERELIRLFECDLLLLTYSETGLIKVRVKYHCETEKLCFPK